MLVVMDMSSYEIEHNSMNEEYSDEVMRSGWNPAVNLVCQQVMTEPTRGKTAMPAELATVDPELFLRKMYAYQR